MYVILSAVFLWLWSFVLHVREEHRFMMFENRVPNRMLEPNQ